MKPTRDNSRVVFFVVVAAIFAIDFVGLVFGAASVRAGVDATLALLTSASPLGLGLGVAAAALAVWATRWLSGRVDSDGALRPLQSHR
jgi:hypothetical protein